MDASMKLTDEQKAKINEIIDSAATDPDNPLSLDGLYDFGQNEKPMRTERKKEMNESEILEITKDLRNEHRRRVDYEERMCADIGASEINFDFDKPIVHIDMEAIESLAAQASQHIIWRDMSSMKFSCRGELVFDGVIFACLAMDVPNGKWDTYNGRRYDLEVKEDV
jgi:hypothetical protein